MTQPHEYERFAARFWCANAFNPSDTWRRLTDAPGLPHPHHCFRRRSIIAIAAGALLAIALLLLLFLYIRR